MGDKQEIQTDLVIIGAGMAGMAAAVFAANRGLSGVVVGGAGAFEYASGLLDLWGVTSPETGLCKDPWQGLARIEKQFPSHPFLKISEPDIQAAFDELTQGLTRSGLSYGGRTRANSSIMTAFGTAKPTYRFPLTMAHNVTALAERKPMLLLDFQGLREFRAKFVQQVLKSTWKKIRIGSVDFPQMSQRSELFTPLMAQAMEAEQVQDQFVASVKPLINEEQFLGMPAILGINRSETILNRLEEALGIKIFEIPTSPISVPGIRLKDAFKKMLAKTRVVQLPDQRVLRAAHSPDQGVVLETGTPSSTQTTRIQAKTCLLATGRFLAKGLVADRKGVTEPLFNLPVDQPSERKNWHGKTYFDPRGHGINLAGLTTDENFRPLGRDNTLVHGNLYAAGSILAGQDWMKTRSGAGISIATAFKVMDHIASKLAKPSA